MKTTSAPAVVPVMEEEAVFEELAALESQAEHAESQIDHWTREKARIAAEIWVLYDKLPAFT